MNIDITGPKAIISSSTTEGHAMQPTTVVFDEDFEEAVIEKAVSLHARLGYAGAVGHARNNLAVAVTKERRSFWVGVIESLTDAVGNPA